MGREDDWWLYSVLIEEEMTPFEKIIEKIKGITGFKINKIIIMEEKDSWGYNRTKQE